MLIGVKGTGMKANQALLDTLKSRSCPYYASVHQVMQWRIQHA